MKFLKLISLILVLFVCLCVFIQLLPIGRIHTNPPVVSEPNWDSSITRGLAKRACFDCHSNETVWPWYSYIAPVSWLVYNDVREGRQSLNFSEWNRPQGGEADEAPEIVMEGEMPPAQYLLTHHNAKLTSAEREQLARGLQLTLGQ